MRNIGFRIGRLMLFALVVVGCAHRGQVSVNLTWEADPAVKGFNLYRAEEDPEHQGERMQSVDFQKLNKLEILASSGQIKNGKRIVTWIDTEVKPGHVYFYYSTSVDDFGKESTPSNYIRIVIPGEKAEPAVKEKISHSNDEASGSRRRETPA